MTLKRLENGEIYFDEPKWTPADTIECLVELEETGEVLPFHATPYDEEAYGRELFEMLSTKYLGVVESCSEQERFDAAAFEVLSRRGEELRASDWIANGDVHLENQLEWLQYRQDLRDITLQEGYPNSVNWPAIPARTHSTSIDERVKAASRD